MDIRALASPKVAIAIAAFSNRKFKIATLTAGSAEKSQKNRGMKSQIAAFRNRKFQIAVFFACETARQVKGAQTFRNKKSPLFWGGAISNRSVSAFSKSQRFRDAKIRASGSRTSAQKTLFSCTPSDGLKVFGPGRPPGYSARTYP